MSTAEVDVAELILRERQSRDRGWWKRMDNCYAQNSTVDISWFTGNGAEFVRASRGMTGQGDHAVHRLSPPTVRVAGPRALVELPIVIEFRGDVDGTEVDLASYARSQYRAEQQDQVWRIIRFTSIYERDTLVASVPGTHLEIDPQDFAGFRPAYRCLAWYLGRRGYSIGADLLGEDQPEDVANHYRADEAWLGTVHQSQIANDRDGDDPRPLSHGRQRA